MGCWNSRFFLYRPTSNSLVPFCPDAKGRWPTRQDDNVLAIHASAVDQVAQRLSGVKHRESDLCNGSCWAQG
jgi:hypothetical protein